MLEGIAMRLGQLICVSLAGLVCSASPALAHDSHAHDGHTDRYDPSWKADRGGHYGVDPHAREAWLNDCRRRIGSRDNGLGGAAIGGVVGGVAGNRIAGRGDRAVGTIAGAAVGAAAGMAIDKAEDGRARDECEAFLDNYYAQYSRGGYSGYGYPGYGHHQAYANAQYGYGAGCCHQPMMMVPIVRQTVSEPECTETVEYEYVDVPVRAKPRPVPTKRVKVVPQKRVKVAPDKRLKTK